MCMILFSSYETYFCSCYDLTDQLVSLACLRGLLPKEGDQAVH